MNDLVRFSYSCSKLATLYPGEHIIWTSNSVSNLKGFVNTGAPLPWQKIALPAFAYSLEVDNSKTSEDFDIIINDLFAFNGSVDKDPPGHQEYITDIRFYIPDKIVSLFYGPGTALVEVRLEIGLNGKMLPKPRFDLDVSEFLFRPWIDDSYADITGSTVDAFWRFVGSWVPKSFTAPSVKVSFYSDNAEFPLGTTQRYNVNCSVSAWFIETSIDASLKLEYPTTFGHMEPNSSSQSHSVADEEDSFSIIE